MSVFLDLNLDITLENKIKNDVNNIIDKKNFINGEEVKIFEENFKKYLNCKYFIGVGNGSDALEIALKSLYLEKNSEVIVQGNTYVATCQAVINNNYKLVTCDVNKSTYQIDINDLLQKITENTKVLIIVHLYGLVINLDIIKQICDKNNIILIEDCAQAHGATFNNIKVGTIGTLGCFSFYPGKNLGAYGDAGGISTNNKNLYDNILYIRNNGSIIKYQHDYIGRNSRLDTIQAVVLNNKLPYLDTWNEKRREIVTLYNKRLKNIVTIPTVIDNVIPVYHLYVIQTNERDNLREYLKNFNIQTIIHYPISICELYAYKNIVNYNKNCIELSNKILSLPLYPELDVDKVNLICDTIHNFFHLKQSVLKFNSIKTINKGGILNCINDLKFDTKRIFFINNFNKSDKSRGHHANKTCREFIFITSGGIKLNITNTNNETKTIFIYQNEGYIVNAMEWLVYSAVEDNSCIIVLCDEIFYDDDSKNINDFNIFINKKYIYYDDLINKRGRYLEIEPDISLYDTYSPSCDVLTNIMNEINNNYHCISIHDSILDVGCGHGFCLNLFMDFKFGKIHGIEINNNDYNICLNNLDIIKSYLRDIQINNISAQEFEKFDDYNFYYFYNPFNSIIFENFIKNIKINDTYIIYYNIHDEDINILKKYNFKFLFSTMGKINRKYYIYKL